MNLFENEYSSSQNYQILALPDAEVLYYPTFFKKQEADDLYKYLMSSIRWQQDDIKMFGKIYPQPRLTALYGDPGLSYTYSNITMKPHSFTKELIYIKQKIEKQSGITFTTCLLNHYRDGQDSNGWHSDNEKELGPNPTIASVSFGQERWFHLKHKKDKTLKQKLILEHGSLLIMKGGTQENWLHQIPKTKKTIKSRINLTFRVIKNL